MNDLSCPNDMDQTGMDAHAAVTDFLNQYGCTDTGGCKAFYSPAYWKDRGESYGLESALIICHDGGGLAPVFNLDYGCYDLHDQMQRAMMARGFYVEACTAWYSAVYRS
jgi:hypothetical protein